MGGLWVHPIKLADGFCGHPAGLGGRETYRPAHGRRAGHLPVRHPASLPRDPEGSGGRPLAVEPRRAAGSRRRIPPQEHDGSTESGGPRPDHSKRPAPGVVLRADRDHRCAGHGRVARRRPALRRTGRPASVVLRLGGARTRRRGDPQHWMWSRAVANSARAGSEHRVSLAAGRLRRPRVRLRRLGVLGGGGAAGLPVRRREPGRAARAKEGAARRVARAGAGAHPRPPAAGGLRLGADQHGLAGARRPRRRARALGRRHGVSLVVRHRDLLPAGAHRYR